MKGIEPGEPAKASQLTTRGRRQDVCGRCFAGLLIPSRRVFGGGPCSLGQREKFVGLSGVFGVTRDSPRGIHRDLALWRARFDPIGTVKRGKGEEERSAETRNCKTENRRQGKVRDCCLNEPARGTREGSGPSTLWDRAFWGAMMRLGGHLFLANRAEFALPIRGFQKSTNCS